MKYLEFLENDNNTEIENNLDEPDPDLLKQIEENNKYEKTTKLLQEIRDYTNSNSIEIFTKIDIYMLYNFNNLIKLNNRVEKSWYLCYSNDLKNLYRIFKNYNNCDYKNFIKFAYSCSNGYKTRYN